MKARENPFATWRLERLPFHFNGTDWRALLDDFDRLGRRAAVVGPHGSGKTTLLEQFADEWSSRGRSLRWLSLTAEECSFGPGGARRALTPIAPHELIILDGAEQLSRWPWFWFRLLARRAGGLLISTHAPGRLPTLYQCRTNPELLRTLTAQLIDQAVAPAESEMDALWTRHRGNLREAFRELYDRALPERLKASCRRQ